MGSYSVALARMTSGQPDAWYIPRIRAATRPLVVYMCGAGDTPLSGLNGARPLLAEIVKAGYCVVQPSTSPLFGNAVAMARIADAITWGQANLPCTNGTPAFVGISNGGICSLQYARQNPAACAVTVIAPVDIEFIRTGDLLAQRANIDAAWGVTYPAALPTHGDILTDKAAYVGLPIQMWVSSNDGLDNPAVGHTQHEFATFVGADYHSAGAVGHADSSWSGVDVGTVMAFVKAHT